MPSRPNLRRRALQSVTNIDVTAMNRPAAMRLVFFCRMRLQAMPPGKYARERRGRRRILQSLLSSSRVSVPTW
jgi:hypothetical protein